jgi:hypothetical protein
MSEFGPVGDYEVIEEAFIDARNLADRLSVNTSSTNPDAYGRQQMAIIDELGELDSSVYLDVGIRSLALPSLLEYAEIVLAKHRAELPGVLLVAEEEFEQKMRFRPKRRAKLLQQRQDEIRAHARSTEVPLEQAVMDLSDEQQRIDRLYKLVAKPWPLPLAWYALRDRQNVEELDDRLLSAGEVEHETSLQDELAQEVGEMTIEQSEPEEEQPESSDWKTIYQKYRDYYRALEEKTIIDKTAMILLQQQHFNIPHSFAAVADILRLRPVRSPQFPKGSDTFPAMMIPMSLRAAWTERLLCGEFGEQINELLNQFGAMLDHGHRKTFRIVYGGRRKLIASTPAVRCAIQRPYGSEAWTGNVIKNDLETAFHWGPAGEIPNLESPEENTGSLENIVIEQDICDDQEKPDTTVTQNETAKNWEEEFRSAITLAIKELDELNLADSETMAIKVFKMNSKRTIIATDTSFERVERAGLLAKGVRESGQINLRGRVIMWVFNNEQERLTSKSRVRRALEIIDEEITEYYLSIQE